MMTELCDGAYLRIHGRLFRVLAIATSTEAANEYMTKFEHAAVLYEDSRGVVYLAHKQDAGHDISKPLAPRKLPKR